MRISLVTLVAMAWRSHGKSHADLITQLKGYLASNHCLVMQNFKFLIAHVAYVRVYIVQHNRWTITDFIGNDLHLLFYSKGIIEF